jgi:DNA invertase Pin-like site-specific DNA recombinase
VHATGLSSLNSTLTQEPLRRWLLAALAAYRAGEILVLTLLDRLARSLPDTHDIVNELATRRVKVNLGG